MAGISFIPIIVVIIIVARTRKLVNKFKNSGATNVTNAKTLKELQINRRFIFNKYLFYEIIVESNKKYYLNEQNLNNYRAKKRMILIPIVVILILILIFMDVAFT